MYILVNSDTNEPIEPMYVAQSVDNINSIVRAFSLEHYKVLEIPSLEDQEWFRRTSMGYTFYRVDYDPDKSIIAEECITAHEENPFASLAAKNVTHRGHITIYIWAKNEEAARKSMRRLRATMHEHVFTWPDLTEQ